MIRDYDIYGVLVHPYVLAMLLSFIALWPLVQLLNRFGIYRYVWHAGLFDIALFFVLYGAFICLLVPGLPSGLFR